MNHKIISVIKCGLFLALGCAATPRVSAQGTWNLDGNFIAPGQFLGSTNFEAVDLKAGGMRVLRLEPDARTNVGGLSGNLIGGFINNLVEQPGSGGNVISGGGYPAGPNVIHDHSQGVFIGAGSANEIGPSVNDAVIGGGYGNSVRAFNSFIGSGLFNSIQPGAIYSVIGGGQQNTIQSNAIVSVIAGGAGNTIRQGGAFIGGGFNHYVGSNSGYGIVVGGLANSIDDNAFSSFIGGGFFHTNRGEYSFIGGGYQNASAGQMSAVPGGYLNSALADYSFAAGQQAGALHRGAFVWADSQPAPFSSTANDQFSVRANGGVRFVTGGAGVTVDGQPVPVPQATVNDANHSNIVNVVNGSPVNSAAGVFGATIAGGGAQNYQGSSSLPNIVTGDFGTVSGGSGNSSFTGGTVGGGFSNASDFEGTVSGGRENSAGFHGAVGGGIRNVAGADASVGGGFQNFATNSAVVGGGIQNVSSGEVATVGGGQNNTSSGFLATVGGGYLNTGSGFAATVGGGQLNTSSGDSSTVAGGDFNSASGIYATVPGGDRNTASGSYSFAAGRQARALHPGTFVWADSQNTSFTSTANNQFLVRAAGGVGINAPSPNAGLHIKKEAIPPGGTLALEGDTHTYLTFFPDGVSAGRKGFFGFASATTTAISLANEFPSGHIILVPGTSGRVGIGTTSPANKLHVAGGVTATSFTTSSDRNAKTNITPVDAQEVLAKVTKLPIARWTFKEMPDGEHMGPMAQDFHAAFGLGQSDKTITTVDPDGVALAAIQGLNQKVDEKESRIRELEKTVHELKQLVRELATRRDP